jgi:hypothetical protein
VLALKRGENGLCDLKPGLVGRQIPVEREIVEGNGYLLAVKGQCEKREKEDEFSHNVQ